MTEKNQNINRPGPYLILICLGGRIGLSSLEIGSVNGLKIKGVWFCGKMGPLTRGVTFRGKNFALWGTDLFWDRWCSNMGVAGVTPWSKEG